MISRRRIGSVLSGVAVALTVAFVVANLRPWLWFLDTTPTGGDLGAHVWAPAYLRDVLLGELRLTGWTHDWYAGFPAFTFYMVIPSLMVVVIDSGLDLPDSVFAHLAVAGFALGVLRVRAVREFWAVRSPRARILLVVVLVGASVAGLRLAGLLDGRTLGAGPLAEVRYGREAVERALAALLLPAVAAGWAWCGLRARPRLRAAGEGWAAHGLRARPGLRAAAAAAAAGLALLVVPMPYGVSLKLVAIAGVVALPVAVWAMARLGQIAAEGRTLAAVATTLFLFDRSFNIYGGNLMSTMAGEFAYSLGLACAVLYIGVAARGMQTGRFRVLAGALLALTGLMHLFSAFFALAATAALLLVLPWSRQRWRERVSWTAVTGMLGAALSAWWVLPFWWNRGLLNDMGWGKERRYVSSLWSRDSFDYSFLVNDPPLQLFVVLAVAGAALVFLRRVRLAMALAVVGAMIAVGFVVLPEGRLWNVRILPFYYLTVYLTAALGIGEAIRWARSAIDRRQAARAEAGAPTGRVRPWAGSILSGGCVAAAAVAMLVTVALPLRALPGGRVGDDGVYRWGPLSSSDSNLGPYWVQYNFEGYQNRPPTADGGGSSEYWDLVDTMARIGEDRGCGPALWEYESGRLGSYGTPMAPMLLPYWTDRCIGSMEGLYFEASATVPYHFLMQSELSASPSRAQRDLPYSGLDVARGTEHLRLMGVRYYLAFSQDAVSQARAAEGLIEVASTAEGPWVVFEVADSAPVVGMSRLPVVAESLGDSHEAWLEASVGAFLVGAEAPVLAADGPRDWPRMTLPSVHTAPEEDLAAGDPSREEVMRRLSAVLPAAAPAEEVEPAEVSRLVRGDHSISFSVDRVGTPVLVRTSYFPNWSVSGAEGPYRVTPNFMVVVPTDTEVRLTYGRSAVQWLAAAMTLAGLAAAAWLILRRQAPEAGAEPTEAPSDPVQP